MRDLVFILLALVAASFVFYVFFSLRAKRLRRPLQQVMERERLEDKVFPHLTPDEQQLPWTMQQLRQLAKEYERQERGT